MNLQAMEQTYGSMSTHPWSPKCCYLGVSCLLGEVITVGLGQSSGAHCQIIEVLVGLVTFYYVGSELPTIICIFLKLWTGDCDCIYLIVL